MYVEVHVFMLFVRMYLYMYASFVCMHCVSQYVRINAVVEPEAEVEKQEACPRGA